MKTMKQDTAFRPVMTAGPKVRGHSGQGLVRSGPRGDRWLSVRLQRVLLVGFALALVISGSNAGAFAEQGNQRRRPSGSSGAANRAVRDAKPLILSPETEPRRLPVHLLGATISPFYEKLLGDSEKLRCAAELHPAYVRFPGGSVANYYQWQAGNFFMDVFPDSSKYTLFWAERMPMIRRGHPNGVSLQEYRRFADDLRAKIVLVPNLETATPENQAAWFKQLRGEKCLPTHIEMGNEFWIAMGNDPNVVEKWPDEPTTIRVTRKYVEAMKPDLFTGD